MRKGFDSLCGVVRRLGLDVFSGHLFVFVSRRGDRMKILAWERGGFVLWYKRLERGRFRLPRLTPGQTTVALDAAQLGMLREGIDYGSVRRPRHWEPPRQSRKGIDSDLKV